MRGVCRRLCIGFEADVGCTTERLFFGNPVSLLCPGIKILERLLLPTLTNHLPVPDHQHGFRKAHSTISALNDFNQRVADGFNKKKPPDRTVLLQIDLSKAFDMVSHEKLLKDLNRTTLPDPIKRWLNCYLHGRQSRVHFRNETSKARNVRSGVPQGAVTSPLLFNFYISLLPVPPGGVWIVQYADDISVYSSGTDINKLTNNINLYIKKVLSFLSERELEVSPSKSTVTLFTPDTKEAKIHPQVKMDNKLVDLDKCPRLLGVNFDTMYTFSHHIKNTVAKAKTKVNILKALAGSTWGQDKETLVITYKSIGRSTLEYGAPIWTPTISQSSWNKLQIVQNQALRTATGSLAMAGSEHVHQECKMLPVKDHCTMVSKQYLAACHQQNHPGNKHLNKTPQPRNLKPTILSYEAEVKDKFRGGLYKDVLKNLHTAAVKSTLDNYQPNRVLGTKPPNINPEEMILERSVRSRLARLRSGFCRSLNSYMSRIDNSIIDACPRCDNSPHDTRHLFNCPDDPTELTVTDLWTRPIQAADFLGLNDEDDE